MKTSILVAFLLVSWPSLSSAQNQRQDGNWWNMLTEASPDIGSLVKDGYSRGLLDGAAFLGTALVSETDLAKEYSAAVRPFLRAVAPRQLRDGLDVFYADYRNRRIEVFGAAYIVLSQIAGKSQNEIDALVERARRLSGQ